MKALFFMFTSLALTIGGLPFAQAMLHTADDCTAHDFSQRLGDARSQGESSWCYAFAAADLLSFSLKLKVSAADIAILETRRIEYKDDITDTRGGKISRAINRVLKNGVCLESRLPSHPEALQASLEEDPDQFWDEIRSACAQRTQASAFSLKSLSQVRGSELIKKLDQLVNQEQASVIGINPDVFQDLAIENQSVDHDVLVLGRRWNGPKNRCEYLIRNSWSTKCKKSYDSDLDCRDGNLWIPEASLRNNSEGVYYLYPHSS